QTAVKVSIKEIDGVLLIDQGLVRANHQLGGAGLPVKKLESPIGQFVGFALSAEDGAFYGSLPFSENNITPVVDVHIGHVPGSRDGIKAEHEVRQTIDSRL